MSILRALIDVLIGLITLTGAIIVAVIIATILVALPGAFAILCIFCFAVCLYWFVMNA